MKKSALLIFVVFLSFSIKISGQDLLSKLDSIQPGKKEIQFVKGTFTNPRMINGYTCETAAKNELYFSISHRFSNPTQGFYDLFGLDQGTIRFGLEYGLTDRIDLGIGRSNYEKLYDGFFKVKIIQQSSGIKNIPVTITWLEGMSVKTQKWIDANVNYPFSGRLYYIHELFIARKFNNKFSMQLTPVIVHRNMVKTADEQNTIGALGVGANLKIARRLTIVCEYYYQFGKKPVDSYNSGSLGVDIETGGGHVFQLFLTNSAGMTEKAFIPETNRNWMDGEIIFGFNIIRLFTIK
jgi:hypothetical protein